MYLICNPNTVITVTGMKVFAYSCRDFDEKDFFIQATQELGLELGYTDQIPTIDNCDLAAGSDFISVMTTPITAEMMDRYKELGIRMISTRCMGFDHIDIAHAKEIGMIVNHINYDHEGIAEFTVMDILMAVRRIKEINARTMAGDFRLNDMMARQLKDLTVGIVGAGKIGLSVLRDLQPFGCKLYYSNRSRNETAEKYAERLNLDDLLAKCDVVSIHIEYNPETYHLFSKETIAKMKQGSILVNTSRGGIVDTEALISALQSGHLGGAALDVIEDEFDLFYYDCRDMDLTGRYIDILRNMPNVIYSHHMAFYYRAAIWGMVYNSVRSMKLYSEGKEVPMRLT